MNKVASFGCLVLVALFSMACNAPQTTPTAASQGTTSIPQATSIATSQGSSSAVPSEIKDAVQAVWTNYKWSETNYGVTRGGGWHLQTGDEKKTLEIVRTEKGILPSDLKALMSTASPKYQDDVWCVSFRPTLYFGQGDTVRSDISMENMLIFHRSDGTYPELGGVWNEKWVTFLYDPGVYKVSLNFYMGPKKSMFDMLGCKNWQGS